MLPYVTSIALIYILSSFIKITKRCVYSIFLMQQFLNILTAFASVSYCGQQVNFCFQIIYFLENLIENI